MSATPRSSSCCQPSIASGTPPSPARSPPPKGRWRRSSTALAEQVAVLDESLEQLYDDQFIETCAPWVAPYIGDLIGYRPLHGLAPERRLARAEVAHTIALRRRKGTASMLEQLARDVTGWEARVVEFFALLATTQYMNHRRPGNLVAPSHARRRGARGGRHGVRRDPAHARRPPDRQRPRAVQHPQRRPLPVADRRATGWRVRLPRRRPRVPRAAASASARSGPTRRSTPGPRRRTEITHLAEPINVPAPILRGALARELGTYYGPGRSIEIHLDGATDPEPVGTDRGLRPQRRRRRMGARRAGRPDRRRPRARPARRRRDIALRARRSRSPTTTAPRATSAAASTRATSPSSHRPAQSCTCRPTTRRSRTRSTHSAAPASSRSPTTAATPRRSRSTWRPTLRSSSARPQGGGRRSSSPAR